MTDISDNIPNSLKTALRDSKVIPFVGAGVSKAIKKINGDGTESDDSLFPTWKEFVETLAETLRGENKAEDANLVLNFIKLAKPKYLEALQHAQEELSNKLWYETFENSFDKKKEEAFPESLKLSELIWQLSNNLIITTNVDRALQ